MKNLTSLISVVFAVLLLSFIACEKDKNDSISKTGVLTGTIGLYEGNCMPGLGVPPCEPTPISTIVAITTPSEYFNIDLLVGSVQSSENGFYEISLPEGQYSIFLQDGSEFICDSWTCPDECFCTLITVKKDSTTIANANIDHAVW